MILGAIDLLQPGDLLKVSVSIAGLRPSDADIVSALTADGLNVARVSTPLFGVNTEVFIRVAEQLQAGELGRRVSNAIDRHFLLVVDADAVSYERVSSIPTEPPGPFAWAADVLRAAVVLAALLLGLYLYREVKS